MKETPQHVIKMAEKIAAESYDKNASGPQFKFDIAMVSKAIMIERQRCLDVCAAEREWGDFHPDDVTERIQKGIEARQIPGWNCPSED